MISLFECSNLTHSYSQKKALIDVSFAINQGTIVGLVGHNGSGKSTLMKILQGILPITAGSFSFDGMKICIKNTANSSLRKTTGVVFQDLSSDDKLTARQNLTLAGKLYGMKKNALNHEIEKILNLTNLSHRADEPLKNLSHGMKRKLELYRTFLHQPRCLLFDEATSGLDFLEVKKFYRFLIEYVKTHHAIALISSHHAYEASHWDVCAFMYEGRLKHFAPVKELFGKDSYINLEVEAKHSDDHLFFSSLGFVQKEENSVLWTLTEKDDAISMLFKSGELIKKAHTLKVNELNLATAYEQLHASEIHHD